MTDTIDYGPTAHYPSEAAKQLKHIWPYLKGNIIDIGSGGWPVVERAIQIELPSDKFNEYTQGRKPAYPIGWHGSAFDLPFKDGMVDTVFSSHFLEDVEFSRWPSVLREWSRVLAPGGNLVILTPDRVRWNDAIKRGQPPNCAHRHEPIFGDVSRTGRNIGLRVVVERFCDDVDYSVLTVLAHK